MYYYEIILKVHKIMFHVKHFYFYKLSNFHNFHFQISFTLFDIET